MKVQIPYDKYEKIMFFVDESTIEISMMARVLHEDDTFTVQNVYLLDQENTAATTDIDAQAMAKLMYESREDIGHLNCWIHSHVDMGVFWSGTDMATINEIGEKGFILAIVFNKKRQMRAAYRQGNTGFLPSCFIDDIPVEITYPMSAERGAWEEEYKAKCKARKWGGGDDTGNIKSIKGGRVWCHKREEFVSIDELDGDDYLQQMYMGVPRVPKGPTNKIEHKPIEEREDGEINQKCPSMRWGTTENKWLRYREFCDTRQTYDSINVLDRENRRQLALSQFKKKHGAYPVDDYALNDWYMEENKIHMDDFYLFNEAVD